MTNKITINTLLNLVSRSFALSIPLLDKNKRTKIEIQYLLARIIDTIEDSNHEIKDKESLINGFMNILQTENTDHIEDFKNIIIEKTISENDKVLIENINLVLKTFFAFKSEIKNVAMPCLREMGYGMIYYQDHQIMTFEDLDDYCYYVAGTVGMYLTELVKTLDSIELNRENAKSLGRLLQKVNIIKDAKIDYMQNRNYWPKILFENENPAPYFEDKSYTQKALEALEKMVESANNEFEGSIKYIMEIEKKAHGYRQFCLLSLIMAYETLKLMKDNYDIFLGNKVKIPRKTTIDIALKVKSDYYTSKKLMELKL